MFPKRKKARSHSDPLPRFSGGIALHPSSEDTPIESESAETQVEFEKLKNLCEEFVAPNIPGKRIGLDRKIAEILQKNPVLIKHFDSFIKKYTVSEGLEQISQGIKEEYEKQGNKSAFLECIDLYYLELKDSYTPSSVSEATAFKLLKFMREDPSLGRVYEHTLNTIAAGNPKHEVIVKMRKLLNEEKKEVAQDLKTPSPGKRS